MELIRENFDTIDQNKIFKIIESSVKKNSNWKTEFPPREDNKGLVAKSDYGPLYYQIYEIKNGLDNPLRLSEILENLLTSKPHLISEEKIKECIGENKTDSLDIEYTDFEEFWFAINHNIEIEKTLVHVDNEIQAAIVDKIEDNFGKKFSKIIPSNKKSWIKGVQRNSHRNVQFDVNTKKVNDKNNENIAELTSILSKHLGIPDRKILDENERKLKTGFTNDDEKIILKFKAAKIFKELVNKKIKITLKKEIRDYLFDYKINMSPVTIDISTMVISYIDIIFGGRPVVSIKPELITYKQAKDIHISKLINELNYNLVKSSKLLENN